MKNKLTVDPKRKDLVQTGICVRAFDEGAMVSADIIELDEKSLTNWLKQRGGDNDRAESIVRILLGHGQ